MNFQNVRAAGQTLIFALMMVVAGCGKKEWESLESESNGYVCKKCGFKFYTDHTVYAEVCPKCKEMDIRPVVAYPCEKCKHLTISDSTHGHVPCENCQNIVAGSILPHEPDLKAWGAVKKTAEETKR